MLVCQMERGGLSFLVSSGTPPRKSVVFHRSIYQDLFKSKMMYLNILFLLVATLMATFALVAITAALAIVAVVLLVAFALALSFLIVTAIFIIVYAKATGLPLPNVGDAFFNSLTGYEWFFLRAHWGGLIFAKSDRLTSLRT